MTWAPYCRELIDTKILSQFERDYINKYHEQCLAELKDELKDDQQSLDYLVKMTMPLVDAVEEKPAGGKKGGKAAAATPESEEKAAEKEKKRLAREANAAKKGGGKAPKAAPEEKKN